MYKECHEMGTVRNAVEVLEEMSAADTVGHRYYFLICW